MLALPIKSRTRTGWQKFDLSSVVRSAEAGGSNWKIHLKFQEESYHGASSDVKLLKPRSVIRFSEKPFVVIFYENNEALQAEEDSGLTEHNQVRRRKRSVNVGPDVRNFYGHDELDQIETEIITMDHTDHADLEKKTEGQEADINDIDSEDELILDYEADDLSEAEANRLRLNIEEKQDLIPYPKWWSAKKRKSSRKRNHHRRSLKYKFSPTFHSIIFRRLTGGGGRARERRKWRADSNETRSQQDKWNLLPKIWRSFGREVRGEKKYEIFYFYKIRHSLLQRYLFIAMIKCLFHPMQAARLGFNCNKVFTAIFFYSILKNIFRRNSSI